MIHFKRLWVATLGLGFVGVACTAPTDAEPTEPQANDEAAAATAEEATAEEATAEDTGVELNMHEPAVEGEVDGADDESSVLHRRRPYCDRRDAWHCFRQHRGWRWVPFRRGWRGDWRDRPFRRDDYCCVRFGRGPRDYGHGHGYGHGQGYGSDYDRGHDYDRGYDDGHR